VYRGLRTGPRIRSLPRVLAQWRGDRRVAGRSGHRAARDPPTHQGSPRHPHYGIRRTSPRRIKWGPPKNGRRGSSPSSRSGIQSIGLPRRIIASPWAKPGMKGPKPKSARSDPAGCPSRIRARALSSLGSSFLTLLAWRPSCSPLLRLRVWLLPVRLFRPWAPFAPPG